jgi:hypothetical protein
MLKILMFVAVLAGAVLAAPQGLISPTSDQTMIPDCGFRELLALK